MIETPVRPPVRSSVENDRGGSKLKLRCSDGHSWAHEFEANSPATLRDGCFEAWVAYLVERDQRLKRNYPTHQTINRAKFVAAWGKTLDLHVWDDSSASFPPHWVNANYGTNSERKIIVRQPGTMVASDWDSEPWEEFWLRCLKCWNACYHLHLMCSSVIGKLQEGEEA